ncbi:MAG: LysR family transcriptional regulator [Paracoccaceae bacterium]
MEIHQMRYFVAMSEHLNFTHAAETCNVSQPALTRAIQKLEDELGGPLFRREGRRTHLTELGRMVRPRFEQALSLTDLARDEALDFSQTVNAKLAPTIHELMTIGFWRTELPA